MIRIVVEPGRLRLEIICRFVVYIRIALAAAMVGNLVANPGTISGEPFAASEVGGVGTAEFDVVENIKSNWFVPTN